MLNILNIYNGPLCLGSVLLEVWMSWGIVMQTALCCLKSRRCSSADNNVMKVTTWSGSCWQWWEQDRTWHNIEGLGVALSLLCCSYKTCSKLHKRVMTDCEHNVALCLHTMCTLSDADIIATKNNDMTPCIPSLYFRWCLLLGILSVYRGGYLPQVFISQMFKRIVCCEGDLLSPDHHLNFLASPSLSRLPTFTFFVILPPSPPSPKNFPATFN